MNSMNGPIEAGMYGLEGGQWPDRNLQSRSSASEFEAAPSNPPCVQVV